jgi:pseudouridine synthase
MRLQRYLAQAGVASRRQAEALIADGAVKINGRPVTAAGTIVAAGDRVEVNGKRVLRLDPIYRILLKPRACLASLDPPQSKPDGEQRMTLRQYLHDPEPGLKIVAPLDFPSEGVILLTSDGELAAALARRQQRVPMTYHLKLQGVVNEASLDRLARGWRWEEVPVRPVSVGALATTGKNTWVEVVVPEIRPRALKAGGDLIRHSVLKISRVRLGGLSFEGLAMGGWRDLTKGEIADLRRRAGLPAN